MENGKIVWRDLTVGDAAGIRDFYEKVVGWTSEGLAMGDYEDFCMKAADGETVAGVCHARGPNTDLPPQWLVYVRVADVDAAAAAAVANGGAVVAGPRAMGSQRLCIVRDPAGAVLALVS